MYHEYPKIKWFFFLALESDHSLEEQFIKFTKLTMEISAYYFLLGLHILFKACEKLLILYIYIYYFNIYMHRKFKM